MFNVNYNIKVAKLYLAIAYESIFSDTISIIRNLPLREICAYLHSYLNAT